MIKINIFIPIIRDNEISNIAHTIYKKIIEKFQINKSLINLFRVSYNNIYIKYDIIEKDNQKLLLKKNSYIDYIFKLHLDNKIEIYKLINKIYNENKLIYLLNEIKENYNFHLVELLRNNKYKFKFRKYIKYIEENNAFLTNLLNEQILEKKIFKIIINLNDIKLNQLIILNITQDLFTNYFKLDIKVKYHKNEKIENKYTILINHNILMININKKISLSKKVDYNFLNQFKIILKEYVINLISNLFDFKNNENDLFITEIEYDFILNILEKKYFINIYPLNERESILISDFLKIYDLLNNKLELISII